MSHAFAAPHADHWQEGEQPVVQIGALAQIGRVSGQRKITQEGRLRDPVVSAIDAACSIASLPERVTTRR